MSGTGRPGQCESDTGRPGQSVSDTGRLGQCERYWEARKKIMGN